ncbi:hypothetical protein Vadar_029250 [Vaccinium darrowii]|uniref:Uncharacterized protein n=1 Tax=Vaccinium darrowii TaxID=229202 RepID=A0ACB7Z7C5_9ERIC|nr:hypothetical protein Vadar_029250 [Vaccinium darrowii]
MSGINSLRQFAADFVKLNSFDGSNFPRWQKKMHFLVTTLNVVYVLTTPKPAQTENETLAETRARLKWESDDYICKGHILNGMSNNLFDVYQNKATAKEIWDALEAKYMLDDAASKKFLATKFFSYKMVDARSVVEQFHEIMHILNQFSQHNMNMDGSISVSSIIDKLPSTWKDVKKSLKHGKEEMTLEQLGQHFQVEEVLRQNLTNVEESTSKVHVMEEGQSSRQPHQSKHGNQNQNKKRKADHENGQNQNRNKKKGGSEDMRAGPVKELRLPLQLNRKMGYTTMVVAATKAEAAEATEATKAEATKVEATKAELAEAMEATKAEEAEATKAEVVEATVATKAEVAEATVATKEEAAEATQAEAEIADTQTNVVPRLEEGIQLLSGLFNIYDIHVR